jgi:hypothetical protein
LTPVTKVFWSLENVVSLCRSSNSGRESVGDLLTDVTDSLYGILVVLNNAGLLKPVFELLR